MSIKPDKKIPTEPELAEKLNASRSIFLRKAMHSFEPQEPLICKQGLSSFRADTSAVCESEPEVLESLETLTK